MTEHVITRSKLFVGIPVFTCLFLCMHFGNAIALPISGCYVAAYLGCDSEDLSCISPRDFNMLTDKNHAVFARYVNASDENDLLNPVHWEWADTLKSLGARPIFFLGPYGGLAEVTSGHLDSVLTQFAQKCAQFGDTVFVVFGHEMNGPWSPWGQQPGQYVTAFQRVRNVLKAVTPDVIMCWIPLQAWGYPWGGSGPGQGYDEYYPGDSQVDWVGLNVYDRDWDETNNVSPDFFSAALGYLSFYQVYAAQRNKPMMIGEIALFDANWDPTAPGVRVPLTEDQQAGEKNDWIVQVYDVTELSSQFPNLNMLCYFHVEKLEYGFSTQSHDFGTLTVDWRIPLEPGHDEYRQLVSDPYFFGARIGVDDDKRVGPPFAAACHLFQSYPNPFNPVCTIRYELPRAGKVSLQVFDIVGKLVRTLINAWREPGAYSEVWDGRDDAGKQLTSGVYFYRLDAGDFVSARKMALLE